MEFATAVRDMSHEMPQAIALLNPQDIPKDAKVILVDSSMSSNRKYLKFAPCHSVTQASIVLPEWVAHHLKAPRGSRVQCTFLDDDFPVSECATVELAKSIVVGPLVDDISLDLPVTTFSGDLVLGSIGSFSGLFRVLSDTQGPFEIEKGTVLKIITASTGCCRFGRPQILFESDEFSAFLARASPGGLYVVRGLYAPLFKFFYDYLQAILPDMDLIRNVLDLSAEPEGSTLLFTGLDVLPDTDSQEKALESVLDLTHKNTCIMLYDGAISEKTAALCVKYSISLHEFDFSFIDSSVKSAYLETLSGSVDTVSKWQLSGLSLADISTLGECSPSDMGVAVHRLQQDAWSLAGKVIAPQSSSWSSLAGYEEQVEALKSACFEYHMNPDAYRERNLRPSKGVLIHGPSGCGKSTAAQALASSNVLPVLSLNPLLVYSKYFGETEARLRRVFSRARRLKPCILLIDDIELIGATRQKESEDSTGVTERILTTLLNELDGIDPLEGVTVVAITSDLEAVDPALWRPGRMDHLIKWPLPDAESRRLIIQHYADRFRGLDIGNIHLAEASSPADIELAFQRAAWSALK